MDLNEVNAQTEVQLVVIGQSLVRGYVDAGAVRGDGVTRRGVPGDGVSQLGVAVNELAYLGSAAPVHPTRSARNSAGAVGGGERRTGREGESRPRGSETAH